MDRATFCFEVVSLVFYWAYNIIIIYNSEQLIRFCCRLILRPVKMLFHCTPLCTHGPIKFIRKQIIEQKPPTNFYDTIYKTYIYIYTHVYIVFTISNNIITNIIGIRFLFLFFFFTFFDNENNIIILYRPRNYELRGKQLQGPGPSTGRIRIIYIMRVRQTHIVICYYPYLNYKKSNWCFNLCFFFNMIRRYII